ncbi:MAG: SCO family protein [Pirellula sp.]|jgi:protein SCO1/2
MKLKGIRILGVLMGLLLGTILAMVSIAIQRGRNTDARNGEGTGGKAAGLSESTKEGGDLEPEQVAPPDPGRRKQLRELIAATQSEPNWTRRFELQERSGKTIRSEELLGQPYVVCFFFSTCPGTCKRQSGEMRLLQSKFKGKPVKLVSISVDPEIDTPEVLKEYAEGFGADPEQWLFLTGELENIIKVGSEMFYLPGVERRGHPDRFCLVDAKGTLVGSYVWLDPDERDQLVAHIEELLSSNN